MKEWKLVEQIQKQRPGWRFSLLGGDKEYGYRTNKDGSLKRDRKRNIMVVEILIPFGWRAEFFGHHDPRKDDGRRHSSVAMDTAAGAIREACRLAQEAIDRGEE